MPGLLMRSRLTRGAIIAVAFFLCAGVARAQLIESWENNADGWQISPFGTQAANFQIAGFSNTTGVSDGQYSMAVGPTATNTSSGPNYSQLLISPDLPTGYALNVTDILKNASDLKFDVFAPSGSFGFFLQIDCDINNSATGFKSLDNFSYQSANLGNETTFTVPIDAATRAQLAASGTGTTIIFQVGGGFTANNETFYIDNVRATPAPEPATIGLLAVGSVLSLRRRK
jgi:hypothetical protein